MLRVTEIKSDLAAAQAKKGENVVYSQIDATRRLMHDAEAYAAAVLAAEDLVSVLLTAQDYMTDAANGALWCESKDGNRRPIHRQIDPKIGAEDLERLNAALAAYREHVSDA